MTRLTSLVQDCTRWKLEVPRATALDEHEQSLKNEILLALKPRTLLGMNVVRRRGVYVIYLPIKPEAAFWTLDRLKRIVRHVCIELGVELIEDIAHQLHHESGLQLPAFTVRY